ncbi:MAG: glycoside hydrolase [Thermoanaerobaculia bacterium]|nr:glycoside hydrolase [Thermoanaerobaculia bacterium]
MSSRSKVWIHGWTATVLLAAGWVPSQIFADAVGGPPCFLPLTVPPEPVLAAGFEPDDDTEALEAAMAGKTLVKAPGTDLNLMMSWESALAADRSNPLRLSVIQGNSLRVSTDGGSTFQPAVNVAASLAATHAGIGDGVPAYDSQGRLFVTFLGNPLVGGGWDVFVGQFDPVDGSLVSGPFNVGDQIGILTGMTADKPWLAADSLVASPSTDRLYVVFAVTGGAVTGNWEIYAATSNDQGATWTRSNRTGTVSGPISPADASDGRCWAPHVAVAVNGDAYVTYHGQPGFLPSGTPDGTSGRVSMLRSIDAGASFTPVQRPFGPGEADTTTNGQHTAEALPGARFWTIGNEQAFILPDPEKECTLHVVTADDPDNDPGMGDGSDVVMASTADCGLSFASPQKIDDGPVGTWQVFPTAAIDPVTGAIAVTWLDNRDSGSFPAGSAGNSRIDLRLRTSLNSGQSWFGSTKVNDVSIDADASNATIGSNNPPTYRIGEYNGIVFSECTAHMTWAGDPVTGGNMDTYYDADPEAGGDLENPLISCPADVTLTCSQSTDPSNTGEAGIEDNCDQNPDVIFFDTSDGGSCPPTPVIDNITRTWSGLDAAGNTATCQQLISIQDFSAPTLLAPNDTVRICDGVGGLPAEHPQIQGWLGSASAFDDCGEAELTIGGVPDLFPVDCGSGLETVITFSAIDECGNSVGEQASMRVTDPFPPELTPPAPATLECRAAGGTPSNHPDVLAWVDSAAASDNCGVVDVTLDGPALLPGSCAGIETQVDLIATDGCGTLASVSSAVTVIDTLPPAIGGEIVQQVLRDPDHGYRCFQGVRDQAHVVDRCGSLPIQREIACESSQCDDAPCPQYPGQEGDGSTIDDCTYDPVADLLCARAERAETNPEGRRYAVTLTATDACGFARNAQIMDIFVPLGCPEGDGACLFRDGFESGDPLAWTASSH